MLGLGAGRWRETRFFVFIFYDSTILNRELHAHIQSL